MSDSATCPCGLDLVFPLLQLSQGTGLFGSAVLFHCFVETNAGKLNEGVFG